jgi:threonine dehydrogenase-like Zn-dependent dehydrogenase
VVAANRIDLVVMVTHAAKLDDIASAYGLFANQHDRVLKVAIKPH